MQLEIGSQIKNETHLTHVGFIMSKSVCLHIIFVNMLTNHSLSTICSPCRKTLSSLIKVKNLDNEHEFLESDDVTSRQRYEVASAPKGLSNFSVKMLKKCAACIATSYIRKRNSKVIAALPTLRQKGLRTMASTSGTKHTCPSLDLPVLCQSSSTYGS